MGKNACKHIALVLIIVIFGVNLPNACAQTPVGTDELVMAGTALAITYKLDQPWSQAWRLPQESPLYQVAAFTSEVGSAKGYVVVLPALYLADQSVGIRAIKAVGVASAVTYTTKILAGRQRPNVPGGSGEFTGFSFSDGEQSFPSGHTAAAFALATVLARTDTRHSWAYYSGATLIGISRINLGSHWPSDVLAGALLGMAVGRWVF